MGEKILAQYRDCQDWCLSEIALVLSKQSCAACQKIVLLCNLISLLSKLLHNLWIMASQIGVSCKQNLDEDDYTSSSSTEDSSDNWMQVLDTGPSKHLGWRMRGKLQIKFDHIQITLLLDNDESLPLKAESHNANLRRLSLNPLNAHKTCCTFPSWLV